MTFCIVSTLRCNHNTHFYIIGKRAMEISGHQRTLEDCVGSVFRRVHHKPMHDPHINQQNEFTVLQ